jgi:hypothetical protein
MLYTLLCVEPEFCFINDTPHVEGNTLELELQLLGCASLLCADPVEPFSEDCKSPVCMYVYHAPPARAHCVWSYCHKLSCVPHQ